jgi:hypothetical protein
MEDAEDDDRPLTAHEEDTNTEIAGLACDDFGLAPQAHAAERMLRGESNRTFKLSKEFVPEPRPLVVIPDGGIRDVGFRLAA